MVRSENISEADLMIKKSTNKPGGTKFKQQKLPAWQPVLSATTVLPALLAVGLCFIPLGIAFIVVTNAVKEKVLDYTWCVSINDSNVTCSDAIEKNITQSCGCEVEFELSEDFPGPVYMYYGLKSYYQNHRRYVKSVDSYQLTGDPSSSGSSDCEPFIKDPTTGRTYAPCGAIANSLFNDTFTLSYLSMELNESQVDILKHGIAWPTDLHKKFQNPDDYSNSTMMGLVFNNSAMPPYWRKPIYDLDNAYRNEDLVVWMRTAAFPNFRKLYGRINHEGGLFANGLKKGSYKLVVEYNYPVSKFSGSKKMILSTTSFLGGKNSFLGIAYLVVGSLSLAFGLVFLIIHLRVGKKTQSLKGCLSKNTPYFDTTMSDLMRSKMNACY